MLIAALALSQQAAEPAPDFSWLTGHWVDQKGRRYSEEIWSDANGSLMTGMSRTTLLEVETSFEFMRIEFTDPPVLIAQPSGGSPVSFVLAEHRDQFARFENPDHDFPTDIIYSREGDTLLARISGPPYSSANAINLSWTLQTD